MAAGKFTKPTGVVLLDSDLSSMHSSASTVASPSPSPSPSPTESSATSSFHGRRANHQPTSQHPRELSTSSVEEEHDTVEFPRHKQREMLGQIKESVAYVLEAMAGDGPAKIRWKPKMEKKGIAYYVDGDVDPELYRFCCVGQISAPVEDVIKLFMLSDPESMLKAYRILHKNVIHANVLSVLQHPTPEHPMRSVYLRYSTFAMPGIMDDRDMCVVIATDVFQHTDGSTIGYMLWDSVDTPHCPELAKTHGIVRIRMFRSGFFLQSNRDGETKIVNLVGMEAGGIAPRMTTRLAMDAFGDQICSINGYFRRQFLDPTTFQPRSQWPSKSSAKFCRRCTKNFGALSSRTNCAACGDVVCKLCRATEDVDLPGVGIKSLRFCLDCLGDRGVQPSVHNGDPLEATSPRSRSLSQYTALSRRSDAAVLVTEGMHETKSQDDRRRAHLAR